MKRSLPPENTPLVLAVTLALWAGSVAAAGCEGVFAKLSPVTVVLLALFAAGFAAAGYALDRGLRSWAAQTALPGLGLAALAADAILVATAIALAVADAPALENVARFPYVMSTLFVAPLAVALHIAAFARARLVPRQHGTSEDDPRVSSKPARSPGANPAAT
jgi:hypothetical protein